MEEEDAIYTAKVVDLGNFITVSGYDCSAEAKAVSVSGYEVNTNNTNKDLTSKYESWLEGLAKPLYLSSIDAD